MTEILIALLPFALGIFHEWTAGILSVVLLAFIIIKAKDNKKFFLPKDVLFLTAVIIPVMFLISPLWATDKGMTLLGFTKFLPIPLVLILLRNSERIEDPFKYLPLSGAVMTVTSFLLGLIFPKEGMFLVSGRLAGFFQYPNTFALFLLISLSLLLLKDKQKKLDLICAPILLIGIILSGSRTVFVLLILFLIVFVIVSKNKKFKIGALAFAAGVIILAGVYVLVTGNKETAGRFLTTSFTSSTFVGRFLYYKDVLPQILKHPLGLGYMGYFYSQTSFQTGVYTVVHVHNDLLQILIDIGWIPAGLICYATVRRFLKVDMRYKVTIALMVLHLLFDFDMQFVSILIIFFVLLYDHDGKKLELKKTHFNIAASCVVLLSLYLAIPSFLSYIRKDEQAVKIAPWYTASHIKLLSKADTPEKMNEIADKILKNNDSVSVAYSAKAKASFSEGDVLKMIEYKNKAIDRNKYDINEYVDYLDMLFVSTNLYIEAGDSESAKYCVDKIKEVPLMLDRVKNGTSSLAYKIKDVPELDLPDEYQEVVDSLG
ncbi:MAG: O-antigen ligase family protein [Clostridiales bacterium]|nr:O-antigen ligase family protein [Clostridiales bacterium]